MYRPNVAIFVNKSDCIALNIDIFLHFMLSTVDSKRVSYIEVMTSLIEKLIRQLLATFHTKFGNFFQFYLATLINL